MGELGKHLRAIRENRNLTMRDVYKHTSITDSKLSRIEHGKCANPSAIDMKKLAKLYGEDLVDLLIMAGYLDSEVLADYERVFQGADLLNNDERRNIQRQIYLITKDRFTQEEAKK